MPVRDECNVCPKSFEYTTSLQKHETHIEERPYKCDVCHKTFAKSKIFAAHKKVHTGERPYKCDVCDKTFAWSKVLAEHKRVHTGERPYKCDICPKSFKGSGDLKRHKMMHTGVRPHQCDVCHKTFTRPSALAEHKRIHAGEKPYECDVCRKSFKSLDDLRKHEGLHTGTRPYVCDVCDKKFTRSSTLTQHKRVHTGERPYECDVCHKRFAWSNVLTKHKKLHKQKDPQEFRASCQSFTSSNNLTPRTKSEHTVYNSKKSHDHVHEFEYEFTQKVHTSYGIMNYNFTDNCENSKDLPQCENRQTAGTHHGHETVHINEQPNESKNCQKILNDFEIPGIKDTFSIEILDNSGQHEKVYAREIAPELEKSSFETEYHYVCEADEFFKHESYLQQYSTYVCYTCAETFTSLYELECHRQVHTYMDL